MEEQDYSKAFNKRNGEQIADDVLKYFADLFNMEMSLGRMMKMMPGMLKFATKGKDCREDLIAFAPKMLPMIKKVVDFNPK